MRRFARARSWFGICAVALAAACTTPTLPLPPPTAPSITTGSEPDHFRLTALSPNGAEPNALIVIVNRNPDYERNKRVTGTLADEHGSWDVEVFAKAGDFLDISQESGTTRSPQTTVQVR